MASDNPKAGRWRDDVAESLEARPGVALEVTDAGVTVTQENTRTTIYEQAVTGPEGGRHPALCLETVLRGNLAMPGSARTRAFQLNPRNAIGALNGSRHGRTSRRDGLALVSRVCLDREVPWHPTGRELTCLVALEAGAALFDQPPAVHRQLNRAGLGVWRNGIQSIAGVDPNAWRVTRRSADGLSALPIGETIPPGARVSLFVGGGIEAIGPGFEFVLQLPGTIDEVAALAEQCDALNELECQVASGAPHIGAWSATDQGCCRYHVRVPARFGRRLPDLPRQLLETAADRTTTALALLAGQGRGG
jgi:hypothetical protein